MVATWDRQTPTHAHYRSWSRLSLIVYAQSSRHGRSLRKLVRGELLICGYFSLFVVLLCSLMRDLAVLLIHLFYHHRPTRRSRRRAFCRRRIHLVKRQPLILNRSRQRSPNLRACDRLIAGLCAPLLRPNRLIRSAIVLKPSTLLSLHQALKKREYRLLFSPKLRKKPGPRGPSQEVIAAVLQMKQRNPTWAVHESLNRSLWHSIFESIKTLFDGFSPLLIPHNRTRLVPHGSVLSVT